MTNSGSVGKYISIPMSGKYSRSGTDNGIRNTMNKSALSILKKMNKKIIIATGNNKSKYFSSEINQDVMKI